VRRETFSGFVSCDRQEAADAKSLFVFVSEMSVDSLLKLLYSRRIDQPLWIGLVLRYLKRR